MDKHELEDDPDEGCFLIVFLLGLAMFFLLGMLVSHWFIPSCNVL